MIQKLTRSSVAYVFKVISYVQQFLNVGNQEKRGENGDKNADTSCWISTIDRTLAMEIINKEW